MSDSMEVSSPGNPTPHNPGWASGAQTAAESDSAAFQDAVSSQHQPSPKPIPMDRVTSANTSSDLVHRFKHHPPKGNQAEHYELLRQKGLELASLILEISNTSREQSLALTRIEEAVFWANEGIVRHE